MKFGVITFPGSNCDQDMVYTLESMLDQKVEKLWHKDHDLKGVDFVILPGGFSYGDYLRSGAIASFSPIMQSVIEHANKGGYVMGVCNGYQMLTETHLLDGALLHNNSQKFICKNVFLKPTSKSAPITQNLDFDKVYKIPIAHGEGRFYASEDELKRLQDNDQILFKYATESGEVADESNPNGSLLSIAGTTNKGKNVFGMMPHPERAVDPNLGNTDGRAIFMSVLKQLV
ncbi:MAG: phosphoribosylformylglycinamidine synthase subunit PurQ [Crocinitomicaceae bacterium]